jgi:hypothetical protein
MNNVKQMLFANWHLMRMLRLLLGIFIGVNALMMHDMLSGLLSGIFIFQAFTNTGCCCGGSCTVRLAKKKEEVKTIFEENKK